LSGDIRHFEDFELDPNACRLSRGGQLVRLERIPLELLCLLVERWGQVVTRDEILERIWGKGVFIDGENAINTAVRKIRRALQDDADAPRFIVTIPAKGYRFVAPVLVANGGLRNGQKSEQPINGKPAEFPEAPATFVQSRPARRRYWRAGLMGAGCLALIAGIMVALPRLSHPPPLSSSSIPSPESAAPRLPNEPSVAILPFVNLSGDPRQDYFSDGITDELTTALGQVPTLFVIARTSTFVYKAKAIKAQDVGRELGVKYILEGSVNNQAQRLRINARLIDAATGNQLWAEHYDSLPGGVFTLQDEIVQRVVTTLTLQLHLWQAGIFHARWRGTRNLDAYDDLLRGLQYLYAPTREENLKARQMYESAIKLDPKYADAYAMLGWTYSKDWVSQWSQDRQSLARAFEASQRAVALDDNSYSGHLLSGYVYLLRGQYDQAFAETGRAMALDPNVAAAHANQAINLTFMGRSADAVAEVEDAMRLDPLNHEIYMGFLGIAYTYMQHYATAIAPLEKYLVRSPNDSAIHVYLAIDYSEVGRQQDARGQIGEVRRISPEYSLEVLKQRMPPLDQRLEQRWYADLSRAGLN
jgi:adenylate cyclase